MVLNSLRKAAEEAANLTPEAVAAKMSPDEKLRLSRVRNIGIAVCYYTRLLPLCGLLCDIERGERKRKLGVICRVAKTRGE